MLEMGLETVLALRRWTREDYLIDGQGEMVVAEAFLYK
jgi:hypothetical protein